MKGKTIVVGVTGGIAVYKAAELVSLLRKKGAELHVIMTESAMKFVSPTTFRTLSSNPVVTGLFDEPGKWNVRHVSLAERADLMIIAPATANIIGKTASGIADDMLSTTIMAARCPVLFAPAMNTAMYDNPILQENIVKLMRLGYKFVGPETGLLACGTEGRGRMTEPDRIVEEALSIFSSSDLSGRRIIVTAGPTREPIDPVRYVSNYSSGKMGYSIAKAAKDRGARVTLISGPVSIDPPFGVELIKVETTDDMLREVLDRFDGCDAVIKAAAPADFKPSNRVAEKIKRGHENLVIDCVPNPDIAMELGKRKKNQILIVFAAETQNLIENAKKKLLLKNADFIVANDLTQPGAGFDVDTNIVHIIDRNGETESLPMMSKNEVAARILDRLSDLLSMRKEAEN